MQNLCDRPTRLGVRLCLRKSAEIKTMNRLGDRHRSSSCTRGQVAINRRDLLHGDRPPVTREDGGPFFDYAHDLAYRWVAMIRSADVLAVETSRMRTIQLEYRRQGLRLGESIEMKVIVDLCVVPMGVGVSVSKYVAECQKVLQEAGLEHQLHAYGTNIEGEWDAVFAAIKRCHERVHAMGAPRITTSIKVGTRTDRDQTMQDKIDSVTDGNL